jgi:hypothetical protein
LSSFAWLATALVWAWRDARFDRRAPGPAPFAVVLAVLLLVAVRKPATAEANPLFDGLYHGWVVLLALLIAAVHLSPAWGKVLLRRGVFLLAVAAAFGFRIWLPIVFPNTAVDTFTVSQESAQHLLEGKNPYNTPVSEAERGTNRFGYLVRAYDYLPANLYLQTAAYGLTGDVRYVYVFAEAVVALAVWLLARRRWEEGVAELVCLLFLYHPCGLFVLEQAWTDPLILLAFALYLLLREGRRDSLASAAYGYMLSLKQYLVFFFVQWFFLERRWRQVLIAVAVGGLTAAPFLIADWRSFVREGVLFVVLEVPFRPDSLTLFGFLWERFGIQPPPAWSFTVGLLITVILLVPLRRMPRLRGYLFAVTTTTFGLFLFGSQAFCNYYYTVGGLLLLLLVLGGKREEKELNLQTICGTTR